MSSRAVRVLRCAAGVAVAVVSVGWVGRVDARVASLRVRPLAAAPWTVAFEANTFTLWTDSRATGARNLHLAMRSGIGANPSVAMLNGGYGVAYQGSDKSLHLYDSRTNTARSLHLGEGSNPSYARLVGTDDAVVAFVANTGLIWTWSATEGARNLQLAAQSVPNIVGLTGGGYEIAYRGTDGSVHVYSSRTQVASTLHLGMDLNTGPAIAALPSGGFMVAINSNHDQLWTWTSGVGARNTAVDLDVTSPSIAATSKGYEIAGLSRSHTLLTVTKSGVVDTHLPGTQQSSPEIVALSDGTFEIAYQRPDDSLATYDANNGAVDRHLGMYYLSEPSIAG